MSNEYKQLAKHYEETWRMTKLRLEKGLEDAKSSDPKVNDQYLANEYYEEKLKYLNEELLGNLWVENMPCKKKFYEPRF